VLLSNDRVSVAFNEADGRWDATWRGGADAAVWRDRFSVEVGGHQLFPQAAKIETAPHRDVLGSGMEIREHWGQGVELERRIRLYHGQLVLVISAQVTNRTAHDVTLGRVRMIDVVEALGGRWDLADVRRAPAAVGYPSSPLPCRPAREEKAASVQQYYSAGVLALQQPGSTATLAIGSLSAKECLPAISAAFQPGKGGTSLGIDFPFGQRVLPAGQTIVFDPVWISVHENGFEALEQYGDAVAALANPPVRRGANALWCSWYPIRMDISEEVALANAAIAARHFKPLGLDVIQLDHGWQRGAICGDWYANERFPHGLNWPSSFARATG
jgi:hypothetical protein